MIKQVSRSVYQIPLGAVNTYVIKEGDGLTLIDTGYAKQSDKIFRALAKIDHAPGDIKRIILTHSHPDHAGSLAELKRLTGAPAMAHAEDAALIRNGVAGRLPFIVTKGFVNWIVFNLFIKNVANEIEACAVEEELEDGVLLPISGGMQVIHTPGHSSGHIALLLPEEDLLIAGDLCANMSGLGLSTVNENAKVARDSILKACRNDFQKAVFGHGKPILKNASKIMRMKFKAMKMN